MNNIILIILLIKYFFITKLLKNDKTRAINKGKNKI